MSALSVLLGFLAVNIVLVLVGLVFYGINNLRCLQGKRPIGYGPNAACKP